MTGNHPTHPLPTRRHSSDGDPREGRARGRGAARGDDAESDLMPEVWALTIRVAALALGVAVIVAALLTAP